MNKLIMLGTGCGATSNYYNTCFIIQNKKGNFLVDTGGSIELINRLKIANVSLDNIKNIFISHSHTDHILGMIWLIKKLFGLYQNKKLNDKINIYCNDDVYNAIIGISKYVLPERLLNIVYDFMEFHILKDGEEITINDVKYTFFDIKAKGFKQFGFECYINNNKLIFLGDETINPDLYYKIQDSDYVMHEAFCLDSEENIFHAFDKHHSTVKYACEIMNELNVKNLILYHTEESHGNDKKMLYEKEGRKYFNQNIIVPNDMDEIIIK